MLKRIKLKYQLNILALVTLLTLCICTTFFMVSFVSITHERTENTTEQMITQVAQNVENMITSIGKSAQALSYDTYVQQLMMEVDPVKKIQLYDYVKQMVHHAEASNSAIYSVTWVRDDLHHISDPYRDSVFSVDELCEEYKFNRADFRVPMYTSVIEGARNNYYYSYIFPIYSLITPKCEKIGCGVFTLDVLEINRMMEITDVTSHSLFAILDQDNRVVAANRNFEAGQIYEDIFWSEQNQKITKTTMEYMGMKSIAQCKPISQNDWKIVSIIPTKELTIDMENVIKKGMLIIGVSMLLLLALGRVLVKSITQPIQKIVDFLDEPESNMLHQRINTPMTNEIGVIATNINEMLDRVDHMTHRIFENQSKLYETQLAERDAELAALQSQINPHFLYNTLNCLSSIGLAYDIPEVADISVAMSNIYRYSIKGDNTVALREEIQCIKEYMEIMNVRFNGKFETEYRIEASILDTPMPRMLMQPLVENAVIHGMEQKSEKGRLVIEAEIVEDCLTLTVQDDGKGMTEEQLEELRRNICEYEEVGVYHAEKRSIGLNNINKRIKLRFGDDYGLQIMNGEMAGVKVILRMPVIKSIKGGL